MNCQNAKKLLIPLLESELSERDKSAVEAHLLTCDACNKERSLLEKTWSMLDGVQVPAVRSGFTGNLMAKIREQERGRVRPVFGMPEMDLGFALRILAPVAASACVIIAVYMLGSNYFVGNKPEVKETALHSAPVSEPEEAVTIESLANLSEGVSAETKEAAVSAAKQDAGKAEEASDPADEDIIRNLDAYENTDLYKNYALISDLDVVENMSPKAM